MPLVAAAVCPHPPMLVPEVAAGAADELSALRSACAVAVAALSGADFIVVVGTDRFSARYEAPVGGSFAPWGLPMTVGEPSGSLPLSLLIGRWLAPRADSYVSIAADASPEECAKLGADLVEPGRAALLIMGDGSACRTLKAPGYLDERAEPFDRAVARALADVDAGALLAVDPGLAAELLAAGRAPWQVLAGAKGAKGAKDTKGSKGSKRTKGAKAAKTANLADGTEMTGDLLYHEAPYGVAYLVASWR